MPQTPPVCPTFRKGHDISRMTRLVRATREIRYACIACGWDYVPDRDEWTWQGVGPEPALAAAEGKVE